MLVTLFSSLFFHATLSYPLCQSSLPGNVMFDPLHLARTQEQLFNYRIAELKHSRLAMLAAVAYPLQEVINPLLSEKLELPNLLPYSTLSPSLVNGKLEISTLIFFLGLGSGLELYQIMSNDAKMSNLPADYNWRLTDSEPESEEFLSLQAGEIWNGRLAMLAVLGYVVQEGTTNMPVLGDFPQRLMLLS